MTSMPSLLTTINKRKGQLMMFTAREMTSASRMKPPSAWYAMIIFART